MNKKLYIESSVLPKRRYLLTNIFFKEISEKKACVKIISPEEFPFEVRFFLEQYQSKLVWKGL